MKRAPVRDILWLFGLTRVGLVIVTYFSYILLTAEKYSSDPVNLHNLLHSWNQWDAANYVRIAHYGYQSIYDTAFFPLLPLLIKSISIFLGSWSYPYVGMLISNLALLGLLFVLYQLAADALGDEVAHRSLLYLCLFPTALFFFAAYNESLFILLIAGAFLAMRRRCWWLAGLLGLLASLTRSAGLLLILPYLWEVWATREDIAASSMNWLRKLLPILLIPMGTAIYCFYCWHHFRSPFAFALVQSHWARQQELPWAGIVQSFYELFWLQPFGSFNQAHLILDVSATLGFIALVIVGWRKLRFSYTLWGVLLLFYVLLSPALKAQDPLMSNQRFVLEVFPAFFVLGALGKDHPHVHQAMIILFPLLQAVLATLFLLNKWMV
jgi:hypothetical protein